ncbi:WD40-repeat-containing domain protein [Apodospora peruviana]|uniref:WD40-repeat-containing domain protein n=1 Tax=Apodospora peruviana TaxID=516989 RepID=A0AAE0MAL9_9PEZI|nr:WD40-repeat-containing domain protein [Apodospora peruviana]
MDPANLHNNNTTTSSRRDNKTSSFPQRPVAQLLGSNGPIHAVSYSASPGSYILTGSADRSIRLYNPLPEKNNTTLNNGGSSYITTPSSAAAAVGIPSGLLIQTYSGHGYEVLSLAIAADNARFASAGGDRAVYLWDVVTAQTVRRFGATSGQGHSGRVNAVAFAGSDDSLLVSGGLDTTVRIWDTKSGGNGAKPIQVLGDAKDAVTSLAVSGDAEVIAGSVDGRVRSYDVRMGRVVADVFPASVTSLCLSRDEKTLLVGSLDSKLRLMDRRDGKCLRTYADKGWRNEELRVQSVFGGGERFVVAGDELTASSVSSGADDGDDVSGGGGGGGLTEGRIWAWDLLTGKLVAKISLSWNNNNNNTTTGVGTGIPPLGGYRKDKNKNKNVVSSLAWKEGGFGNQFCVGGTSGVVTVFGE